MNERHITDRMIKEDITLLSKLTKDKSLNRIDLAIKCCEVGYKIRLREEEKK